MLRGEIEVWGWISAVRVMDCDGEGAMSTIITGLEWILENLELPAVVLMSIGGDATLLLDQACEALVTAGATVVVAAGNDDEGESNLHQCHGPGVEFNRCCEYCMRTLSCIASAGGS